MHWAVPYIGIKYAIGGRSHEGLDCWGLVKLIYHEQFKIELPSHPGITVESAHRIADSIRQEIDREWERVDEPFDGCGVAMSQSRAFHHVGVYADADHGKIIHAWETHCVIADSHERIKLKGFTKVEFYRHHLWPMSSKFEIPFSPPRTVGNIAFRATGSR